MSSAGPSRACWR